MTHVPHGDVHTDGLADGCPDCAEIAAVPFRYADEDVFRELVRLALTRDRHARARSQTELVASTTVLNTLERMGRACEVAGDLVAEYLQERWRLTAEIEPRDYAAFKAQLRL